MNVWGAPERVRPAHLANQRAQLSQDLRSANMVARSPGGQIQGSTEDFLALQTGKFRDLIDKDGTKFKV